MKNKYKEMTEVELNNAIKDLLKERYDLYNKLKIGKLSNYARIKTIRRNIAMIKTELNNNLRSNKIEDIEKQNG